MMMTHQRANKPILITTGEPSGIGMDIVIDLASKGYFTNLAHPIVITACEKSMLNRYQHIQRSINYENTISWQTIDSIDEVNGKPSGEFYLLNIATNENVIVGKINVHNASMVLKQLSLAHQLAIENKTLGIVTAPLQKSALIDANLTLPDGSYFSGHTEYFMQMSGIDGINKKVVMMLANAKLKVALVTTHLPLSEVAKAITTDKVKQTVQIVLDSMIHKFGIKNPRILVCGLNPHAGEGGHLGMEEIEIINPVLQQFIDVGHDVSLSLPADTLFTKRYMENCDATIAMYHDQGLPVLKSHGFGDSVNITLGLPYVRTSVDHGTALDIAGSGLADSGSLKYAIESLIQMS